MKQPKIAIVHDWLTNMGGAEKLVLAMHEAFPDAPIYTSTYISEKMPPFKGVDVRTTYLQKFPKLFRKLHKFFPSLRINAFRKLDLSQYDIIVSSSSAEAKQVRKTRPGQIHICYCHSPIRYYWEDYDQYKKNPGFGKLNWLMRLLMPIMVPPLKRKDFKAAQNVDYFIGNSNYIASMIKKHYRKEAAVIHPPVDTHTLKPAVKRGDFYMTLSRQIPYKRLDLAVLAANKLKLPLKVFGNGSEHQNLRKIAGPTVEFIVGAPGFDDQDFINQSFGSAKGFIFPAKEDFGITPIEAMAGGSPVIAFNKGGALDYVTHLKTGVLFEKQTVKDVVEAIKLAEKTKFNTKDITNRAKEFSKSEFIRKIQEFVNQKWQETAKKGE